MGSMARPRTTARVHAAVLGLVAEVGWPSVTMEGVAARAGVSKQTVYRSWPSTAAVLFDALLTRSTDASGTVDVPDTGHLEPDLVTLLTATAAEMVEPATERVLRAMVGAVQDDEALAAQYRNLLHRPQIDAVQARLVRAGITDPNAAELLMGAVLHRWLLRTGPFTDEWIRGHVARVVRSVIHTPPG